MTKFLLNDLWAIDLSQIFDYNISKISSCTISKPKDFVEFDEQYEFHLAVPGLTKEDINIILLEDSLHVGYSITKEEGKPYFICSNFRKTLTIPEDANKQGIEAEVKNGVLTVVVPKQVKKSVKPKHIEVK